MNSRIVGGIVERAPAIPAGGKTNGSLVPCGERAVRLRFGRRFPCRECNPFGADQTPIEVPLGPEGSPPRHQSLTARAPHPAEASARTPLAPRHVDAVHGRLPPAHPESDGSQSRRAPRRENDPRTQASQLPLTQRLLPGKDARLPRHPLPDSPVYMFCPQTKGSQAMHTTKLVGPQPVRNT